MGESESDDSAQLRRRLWMLRAAILPCLVLVLGPLFLEMKWLRELPTVGVLYAGALFPAVVLYLGALLCKERPGLGAVVLWGALLSLLTLGSARNGMAYVHYTGWRPVVWMSLLALSQLSIVLAAGGAWLLAPSSEGPGRHLAAVAAGMSPFVIWAFLTPTHGWGGHRTPSNEAATMGDIRTVISAEAAYQSANGGFYDVPECLVAPQPCIPAYPANAPTFLDSQLGQTTAVKSGYHRVFHPGPPVDPAAVRQAGASASSLQSFAYTAVPLVPEQTGVRGFCGDSNGRICFTPDGHAPAVENGQCAASCQDLQ